MTPCDPAKRPTLESGDLSSHDEPVYAPTVTITRANYDRLLKRSGYVFNDARSTWDRRRPCTCTNQCDEKGRTLVRLIDWADWIAKDWRTKVDTSDDDLRKIRDAISRYLDRTGGT